MKLAVFEGEIVLTQTKGFSSMLIPLLGTKSKPEGTFTSESRTITYFVIVFFAKSSEFAVKYLYIM